MGIINIFWGSTGPRSSFLFSRRVCKKQRLTETGKKTYQNIIYHQTETHGMLDFQIHQFCPKKAFYCILFKTNLWKFWHILANKNFEFFFHTSKYLKIWWFTTYKYTEYFNSVDHWQKVHSLQLNIYNAFKRFVK